MNTAHALIIIAVMAVGTAITRFLPFLLFRDASSAPRYVKYLGKMLPAAAVGLLVVYCLRHIQIIQASHGLPEAIAIFVVIALHVWKKNTLFSIVAGTACYMVLVQFVF